ncbi:hypothetical protein [Enterovibrio norvegicus]|uniref:hypothetical protein n=1 Tax=Enterovibrio norvegicus TaxID=188144 RepID=UPI00352C02B8
MLELKKYTSDNKNEWDKFCIDAKNSMFLFQRDFVEYHEDRFLDHSILIYRDNKILGLFLASEHGDEIRAHGGLTYGGFISKSDIRTSQFLEIFEAVNDYYRDEGFKSILVKVMPESLTKSKIGELDYAMFISGAKLKKCDLSTVIEYNNRGKISKGRKWIINKAKKSGVRIFESEDFGQFCVLLNEVLAKHKTTSVHTAEELTLLKSKFNEKIILLNAEYQGQLVSAVLLFVFDDVVHTQYLATNDMGKEVGALDLAIDTAICRFEDKRLFSFGISTEDSGKKLNYGLCQQKESFGGVPISVKTFEVSLK